MSIEAMKQALEALLHLQPNALTSFYTIGDRDKAITALRQAIAEAEKKEPVAWGELLKEADQIVRSKILWKRFIDGTPLSNDIPVWMADFARQYTTPQPQREWVGLTPDEVFRIADQHPVEGFDPDIMAYTRAIEAKLKEKNR